MAPKATFKEKIATKLFWLAAAFAWLLGGEPTQGGDDHNLTVRHEWSDINTRGVMLTAVSVLLGTWLISILLIFVFHHFKNAHEDVRPSAAAHQVEFPPEPRLQESPSRDLKQLQAEAEKELSSYKWIDRQKGIVAIPIERAMELTAQRGITRSQPSSNNYFQPREGSPLTGFEEKNEAGR